MTRLRIAKSQRIRSSLDFQRIYDLKQRVGDDRLLVFGGVNGCGQTRFGLSVSRKHGNAVKRNRLKRLLREAFRLSQHELPAGLDLILIPRQNMPSAKASGVAETPDGLTATVDNFRRSLVQLSRRLAKRLQNR